eukprot:19978_2
MRVTFWARITPDIFSPEKPRPYGLWSSLVFISSIFREIDLTMAFVSTIAVPASPRLAVCGAGAGVGAGAGTWGIGAGWV